MRIAIASRIFDPEPSAASFRLYALAQQATQAGHEVTVFTAEVPKHLREHQTDLPFTVRRARVLRDASGYVRGYLQYLSYDVPLFFRLLFGRKQDVYVVEPPPTTLLVLRWISILRRTPYVAYAPDVWSDASEGAGAPGIVVKVLRRLERLGWCRARAVLSVHEGVTQRLNELAPEAVVHTVGNGVNTAVFTPEGPARGAAPFVLYAGTASEWQGAEIFIEAMRLLEGHRPELKLIFLGQGTAWPQLAALAKPLGDRVRLIDSVPPQEAAAWMRGAVATLASIHPDSSYSFAYPTKVFASWACGTPVIYAGPGLAKRQLDGVPVLGQAVAYDAQVIANAIDEACNSKSENSWRSISAWAQAHVSLDSAATRATEAIEIAVSSKRGR